MNGGLATTAFSFMPIDSRSLLRVATRDGGADTVVFAAGRLLERLESNRD